MNNDHDMISDDEDDDDAFQAAGDCTLTNKRMQCIIWDESEKFKTSVTERTYHDEKKLKRFANYYDTIWHLTQGQPGFNEYFAEVMQKAMEEMEKADEDSNVDCSDLNHDRAKNCTVNTLNCPNPEEMHGSSSRISDVPITLKPYQMTVKYMFSPNTEGAIQRMLFCHGLGTGKTISMIQILDNFAHDSRPKVLLFYSVQHINGFFRELCTFQSYTRNWLVCRTHNWFEYEHDLLYRYAKEAVTMQKLQMMKTSGSHTMLWRGPIAKATLWEHSISEKNLWGEWNSTIDDEMQSWFPPLFTLQLDQYDKSLLPYFVIVMGRSLNLKIFTSTYADVFEDCAKMLSNIGAGEWLKFYVRNTPEFSLDRMNPDYKRTVYDEYSIAIVLLTYLNCMLEQCMRVSDTPELIELSEAASSVLKSIQEIAKTAARYTSRTVFETQVQPYIRAIKVAGGKISINPVESMVKSTYGDTMTVMEVFQEMYVGAMEKEFGIVDIDNSGVTTWDLCDVDIEDVIEHQFPSDRENSDEKMEEYVSMLEAYGTISDGDYRQLLFDEIICSKYIVGYRETSPNKKKKNQFVKLRRVIRQAAKLRELSNIYKKYKREDDSDISGVDDMIQGASKTTEEGTTVLSFVQSLLRFTNRTSSTAVHSGKLYELKSPVIAVNYYDFTKEEGGAKSTWSKLLRYGKKWHEKEEVGTMKEKIVIMDEAHNLLSAGTRELETELKQKIQKKEQVGHATQELTKDIKRLQKAVARESLSRDNIRQKLLNLEEYKESRVALFTATPIISSIDDLDDMLNVVCGKSHNLLESKEGFVSFFRGRPVNVFPEHRPAGDAPEIRVVAPTYIRDDDDKHHPDWRRKLNDDWLRPIVGDCCKFKNHKPTVKKRKDESTEHGKFSLSVESILEGDLTKKRVKLMRRNLQDYVVSGNNPNLLSKMETFLRSYETQPFLGERQAHMEDAYYKDLLPLAIIKCPKLLQIANDIADKEEAYLKEGKEDDGQKTIVMVAEGKLASDGEGIVTMTLLLRVEATRRPLLREKWAENMEVAYKDQDETLEIRPKFSHMGTGENMPLARQCDRGKSVNRLTRLKEEQKITPNCRTVGGDLTMRNLFAASLPGDLDNARGWRTKVFVANASAYTESVSFENVRRIILASVPATAHSMLQQIGRASRLCKHDAFRKEGESYLDVQIYLTAIPVSSLVSIFETQSCTRFQGYNMGQLFSSSAKLGENCCGRPSSNSHGIATCDQTFSREEIVALLKNATMMPGGETFANSQFVQGLLDYDDDSAGSNDSSKSITSVKDMGAIVHTADTITYQGIENSLYEFQAGYSILREMAVDSRMLNKILGPENKLCTEAREIYENYKTRHNL